MILNPKKSVQTVEKSLSLSGPNTNTHTHKYMHMFIQFSQRPFFALGEKLFTYFMEDTSVPCAIYFSFVCHISRSFVALAQPFVALTIHGGKRGLQQNGKGKPFRYSSRGKKRLDKEFLFTDTPFRLSFFLC